MISQDFPILWMNATTGAYNSQIGNSLINILHAETPIVEFIATPIISGNFDETLKPAATYRLSSTYAPYVSQCYANDEWYRIPRSRVAGSAYPFNTKPTAKGLFFIMGYGNNNDSVHLTDDKCMSVVITPRNNPMNLRQSILNMDYMGDRVRNSNILLGGLAREKIIMVPRLTVMDSSQQITSVSIKDYTGTVAENYPYIKHVFLSQVRYKDDSTNATINLVPMVFDMAKQVPTRPKEHYPDANTYYGAVMYNLSTIFMAPSVERYSTDSFYSPWYIDCTHNNSLIQWDTTTTTPQAYTTLDNARRMINSLGLWWAESVEDVADVNGFETTSPYVHCPFVQSSGDTTTSDISGQDIYRYYVLKQDVSDTAYNPDGFTLDGSQSENNPAMSPTATQDFIGSSGFTPLDPEDEPVNPDEYDQEEVEDDDDVLKPTDEALNAIGAFVNYYALSLDMLKQINDKFYENDGINWDAVLSSLMFYTNNPSEAMVSLMMFPFDISRLQRTLTYSTIRFGTWEIFGGGTFRALEIQPDTKMILDLGTGYIPHKYNNFLDLSPYTTVNMFVPYCGTVELNPTDLMDKKINVQMIVDLTTGSAKVVINANDIPIMYLDCMVGASLPYTATQFSQLLNGIIGFIPTAEEAADFMKNFRSEASTGESLQALSEGISTVGKKIGKFMSTLSDPPTITKIGSPSSITNFSLSQQVYFVVGRPKPLVGSLYGHTNGFVCYEEGYLRDYSGFVVCDNPDLSHIPSATEEERTKIYNYLTTGVFL